MPLHGREVTVASLLPPKSMSSLEQGTLVETPQSVRHVGHRCRLGKCKKLKQLNLNGTKVTAAALVHLTECKKLQVLELHGCKVTQPEVEELHRQLPSCKISWGGGVTQDR